jgi:S-adenosylmethionine:tRNA ribosyltransferase-isomerase
MKSDLLDYYLPEELIAQRPPDKRGASRLLDYSIAADSAVSRNFEEIAQILDDRYFLILNDTLVLPARIYVNKPTGGKRELLFLSKTGEYEFNALVRGKTKKGDILLAGGNAIKALAPLGESWLFSSDLAVDALIAKYGQVALPPYIRREADEDDRSRYQTVYAENNKSLDGSAAAPTAGLHFTDAILEALKNRGVDLVRLTLQVGLGTFRPIKTENTEEHVMHSERYLITEEAAAKSNALIDNGKIPLCVGTTAVRAVESAAVHTARGWRLKPGEASTDLFIIPGYEFKIAKALLTNFHLPRSSLLLLVSAFTGLEKLKSLYARAVEERCRFFSYGDAMLIR